MWNAYTKWGRLKAAMRSRKIDPDNFSIDRLADVLDRRGITDSIMNPIVWGLIGYLEPPACWMTHCKHYGCSPAPCNCADGRIPGRCKILRDYKIRQKIKEAKNLSTPPKAQPYPGSD